MASTKNKPKFVIGLGASAGGLDALEQFFEHAPLDSGAAFVVVMHLSRDFKSMLDELLGRRTTLKVEAAADGANMVANTVYVIQPGTVIEVDGLALQVEKRPPVDPTGVATAVDGLFRSIAKHWGSRGAGIVFSGSGSDGAKGIRAIYEAGGFTCAQSPETSKFDPMPNAAIATESVNAVESPDHLATTVIEGLLMPMVAPTPPAGSGEDEAMSRIVDALIGSSSVKAAAEYKHSTFERRVSRRMMDLRIRNLSDYADRVSEDPEEAQKLSQELLIGVTEFFRDKGPYDVMRQEIVPQLIKAAHEGRRSIRIWIAGCATGEEVYSMAMLFREALRDMPFEIDVQIFATDISKKHIAKANRGQYTSEQTANIPRTLLQRYFVQEEGSGLWTVIKRLRQMVVFAQHDLLSDPPFTKLDLISCRNVLIYFSVEAQQRILSGFAFGLNNGGFLLLGSSETVGGQRDVFEFVDARNRVFRRTQSRAPARALSKSRELFPLIAQPTYVTRSTTKIRESELQPAYSALLADYAPASLLISSERQLMHTFGDASRFLRAPSGVANLDIVDLIDPSMKTPLIAALERASKGGGSLSFSRISLQETPEAGMLVDLTVKPLPVTDQTKVAYLLVIIDERQYNEDKEPDNSIPSIDAGKLVESRVTELETELARTREALQSTIEEIETANEELQASNEELMSANEELQSTNEELSSVNEELYSVNAEYHRQNNDLNRLTSDFDLLLDATQIGVLFLDEDCRITRFTGLARQIFNLEESDIERSLDNFKSPFEKFDAIALRDQAKATGSFAEIETTDGNGEPWIIRAVLDDASFGVVLAFIDISDLRNAEEQLRQTHRMLETIRKTSNAYFIETDPTMKTVHRQTGFDTFIGVEDMQLPFELPYTNVHKDDREMLLNKIKTEAHLDNTDVIYRMYNHHYGKHRYIQAIVHKLDNGNYEIASHDIDDIYRAEIQMREQRVVLDAALAAGRSYRAFVDKKGIYRFANQLYLDLVGKERGQIIGQHISKALPPAIYDQAKDNIEAALKGEDRADYTEVAMGEDICLLSATYQAVQHEGQSFGFVFDGINISELAKYAERFTDTDRFITAVTRNSEQPTLVVDINSGNLQFANHKGEEMLGLSQATFEPDMFKISRISPEIGDKRWQAILQEAAEKKELMLNDITVFDAIKSSLKADIHIELSATLEEQPQALVRVILNPEKANILEDLRERSRKLANSNRDLEQFTSAVAHDLRAPLRHITSFAELLEMNLDTLEKKEIKHHADLIRRSARNLSNMVAGLLDYARTGMREKDMVTCNLNKVIQAVKGNLADEIASSDATIKIKGNAKIVGNFELLISLFQNLIGNAIKYRKTNKKPKIVVTIEQHGGLVSASVSDNGIGIDADFSGKIFELFKRLHSESEYEGLGVGLTTCRKIAELHKSEIHLDSEYSGGSRFVIERLRVASDDDSEQ